MSKQTIDGLQKEKENLKAAYVRMDYIYHVGMYSVYWVDNEFTPRGFFTCYGINEALKKFDEHKDFIEQCISKLEKAIEVLEGIKNV